MNKERRQLSLSVDGRTVLSVRIPSAPFEPNDISDGPLLVGDIYRDRNGKRWQIDHARPLPDPSDPNRVMCCAVDDGSEQVLSFLDLVPE